MQKQWSVVIGHRTLLALIEPRATARVLMKASTSSSIIFSRFTSHLPSCSRPSYHTTVLCVRVHLSYHIASYPGQHMCGVFSCFEVCILTRVSSPWSQDRPQSLWSGRIPHGKKNKPKWCVYAIRSPWWSSGYPRILLALVLQFDSHRGESGLYLENNRKESTEEST